MTQMSSGMKTGIICVGIGMAAFLGLILGFGSSDGGANVSARGDTLNQIADPSDPITAGLITRLDELTDPSVSLDRQFEILEELRDLIVDFMERAANSQLSADRKTKIETDGNAILAAIDALLAKRTTATRGEIQEAARKINKSVRDFSLLWVGGSGSGAAAAQKAVEIAQYNDNGKGSPPRIPYWQGRSFETGNYGRWARTDCSAFVSMAYRLSGRPMAIQTTATMLDRDGIPGFVNVTAQIYTNGRRTTFSDANPPALQAGDIIVYRNRGGHVVMYTGTNWKEIGSIAHSTGSCCARGTGGFCSSCSRAWPRHSGPQLTSTAQEQLRIAAGYSSFGVFRPE